MLDSTRARLTPWIREAIHESILAFPEPLSTLASNRSPAGLPLTDCGLGSRSGTGSESTVGDEEQRSLVTLVFRRSSLSGEEKGEVVETAVRESIVAGEARIRKLEE